MENLNISNRTAVIDGDSLIFTIFHPNKVLDSNNQPKRTEDNSKFLYKEKSCSEIVESADFSMNDILTKCKADSYILLIKGKNTTKSKELINPEYKANREKAITPKFWNFVKECLKLKWNAIEVNDIETDDAVNICRLSIKDSFIVAIDGDLLSLEGTHYNWRKDQWIINTKEQEEYKFWSDMIVGTHNNCFGIKGKGEKYVEKLFKLDHKFTSLKTLVLDEFIYHFGEYNGIKEFNKNYFCNKILDSYEGFSIPNIVKFNNKDDEWGRGESI